MFYKIKSVYRCKNLRKGYQNKIDSCTTQESIYNGIDDLKEGIFELLDIILDNNHNPKEPQIEDILKIGLYGNSMNKIQSVFDYYKHRYNIYKEILQKISKDFPWDDIVIKFDYKTYRYSTDDDPEEDFMYDYIIIGCCLDKEV